MPFNFYFKGKKPSYRNQVQETLQSISDHQSGEVNYIVNKKCIYSVESNVNAIYVLILGKCFK